MMIADQHLAAPPPALASARHALSGLAALLNSVDPGTWASLARPTAPQLTHLLWAILGKLDTGMAEAGFASSD